jgi:hypothetical protein
VTTNADTLTDADRALLRDDDSPDLPLSGPPRSGIIQSNSPELIPDDEAYLEGAQAGDIVLRFVDGRTLVKGSVGFVAIAIGFDEVWVEYGANRGSYVDTHTKKPDDADWRTDPATGRKACLRPNNNKIENTVVAHLLVDGRGVNFPFRSTALSIGREFGQRAFSLRAKLDGGDVRGYPSGKRRIATRLEKEGDFRWFLPVVTLVGKVNQTGGPTIAEWRAAMTLRKAFREGLAWAPDPPAPPSIEGPASPPPEERPRGAMTSASRKSAWAVEEPPAVEEYDGPDNPDSEPFDE